MQHEVIWSVRGPVVQGERRGRVLGYPTANVDVQDGELPPDGVYAATVLVEDEPEPGRPAAVSVGTNPTFNGTTRTVEAYLLDWDGDLYGRRIEVRGHRRVRGMVTYASVDDLLVAMARDVAQVRRDLSGGE